MTTISSSASRSSLLSQPLSPIAITCLILVFERLLQSLKPCHQLLLFAGCKGVPHARSGTVQELPGHRSDATHYVAAQDLLCEVLEAGKLRRWTTTATPLTALRGRPSALLCTVRVMGVAVVGAINSYTPTTLPIPRYASAFSQ